MGEKLSIIAQPYYVHVPRTIRVSVDWIPRESNVHSVPYTYTLHVRVRVRVRLVA